MTSRAFGVFVFLFVFLLARPGAAQGQREDPSVLASMRFGPLALTPTIAIRDVGVDTNVLGLPEWNPEFTMSFVPGVRAWLTIYVAHKTGSVDLAAGFDHVVYGGVFFAIVIAIILALGWRFFDRGVNDPWFDPQVLQPEAPKGARLNAVTGTLIGLILAPVAWLSLMSASGAQAAPADIACKRIGVLPMARSDTSRSGSSPSALRPMRITVSAAVPGI